MSDECRACEQQLANGAYLTCTDCQSHYHVGNCSGVGERAFKKKNDAAKKSWKCEACKQTALSPVATRSGDEPEISITNELSEIHRKLSTLLEMKSKVDSLEIIKSTVHAIENSMQEMSKKYDEVVAQMKLQHTDISDLRKRMERLEEKVKEQEVEQLRKQVNDLEQYSRRMNLEVHGLPQHTDENLLDKLNVLATELDLPQLSETDIEAVHRLPSKPKESGAVRAAPILVRFSSRVTKEAWLEKKRKLKQAKSKIFFNENLTAQNKALFWQMRTKAKEKEYQFTWHRNGRLFVSRGPRDKVIRISTVNDLDRIK